jgi:hypothetical protein
MRDYLEPFRDEMNKLVAEQTDIIEQGCLLWRMVYAVVDGFQTRCPEFIVVRHEDLSRQPLAGFRQLYTTLGLAFTPKVQQTLLDSSQGKNPTELSANQVHAVNLNSQVNLFNWKKRLTDEEVDRIQESTAEVAAKFYPKEIWEPK